MVGRLVDAGHQVRALGRSDEKRSAIAELGAEAVDEIVAVCAGAEAVVLCVFTDEQVRDICLADGLVAAMPSGLHPGAAHHRKPPHRRGHRRDALRRAAYRWWTHR